MSSRGERAQGTGHLPLDILALVERLVGLTEQQVAAARTLEGPVLQALDQQRSDALFELQVALDAGPDLGTASRDALRDAIVRLRSAEDRLVRVSRTVLGVLAGLRPKPPVPTYGRSGHIHARQAG
jgi:hypothetical protein